MFHFVEFHSNHFSNTLSSSFLTLFKYNQYYVKLMLGEQEKTQGHLDPGSPKIVAMLKQKRSLESTD